MVGRSIMLLFLNEEGVSRKVQGRSKVQRGVRSDGEEGAMRRNE